jgi:hypothetical protein
LAKRLSYIHPTAQNYVNCGHSNDRMNCEIQLVQAFHVVKNVKYQKMANTVQKR